MALKIEVNSLDEIDAALRQHYEKIDDGRYRLAFDGLDKLKNSEQVERGRRKAAENRVKELETQVANLRTGTEAKEVTPREQFIRENATRLNGLEGDAYAAELAKIQQEMEPLIEAEVAEHSQTLHSKVERQQRAIRTLTIERAARQIIFDIGRPGADAALLPHVVARLGCSERDGDWAVFVTDAAGKPTAGSLDTLKNELRSAPAFGPLVRGVTESETAAHARKVQAALSPGAAH